MTHNSNIHAEQSTGQTIPQDPLTFLSWLYGDDAPGWLTISTFNNQPTQWFEACRLEDIAIYCQAIARRYNCLFLRSGCAKSTFRTGGARVPMWWEFLAFGSTGHQACRTHQG